MSGDPFHRKDCCHIELEDNEGLFTLHVPPSVFEAMGGIADSEGHCSVSLSPPFEGCIVVHVERGHVVERYALTGLG